VDECQGNSDCGDNQVCNSGSCSTLQPLEILHDIMDEMELQLDSYTESDSRWRQKIRKTPFFRTDPLWYHKFGNMVIFRTGKLIFT